MAERELLACVLKSRKAYDKVQGLLDDVLSEQGKIIFEEIRNYYTRDGAAEYCATNVIIDLLSGRLENNKHRDMFTALVRDIAGEDVSAENVVHTFIEAKAKVIRNRLAAALSSGAQDKTVRGLIDEYEQWSTADSIEDVADTPRVLRGGSIAEILASTYDKSKLISVSPAVLNERLDGGLVRGHHMIVFAVPEAGKTLFSINLIAGFLDQSLTVLYVGNEDPVEDIILRVVTRLSEMTKYEVLDDPDFAEALAKKRNYDNLILASLAPGTPAEIDRLAVKYKPDVLIVDQIRNLHVGTDDAVSQMDVACKAMRRMAKRRNMVVVSITQAADSASGKAILEANDVYYSNTACAAQADVMVGVGGSGEDFTNNRRVLSLPKNKLSGRHDWVPVQIEPQYSKITEV